MEIVLKRIAKKDAYTIGKLYILPDKNQFDMSRLTKDRYFCDTLEPTWRNLLGIQLPPEMEDARYSRKSGVVARKIPGETAIPEGSYPVVVTWSPRFKHWLPLLEGENKKVGMVVNSRICLSRLILRIREAKDKGEGIWITIL